MRAAVGAVRPGMRIAQRVVFVVACAAAAACGGSKSKAPVAAGEGPAAVAPVAPVADPAIASAAAVKAAVDAPDRDEADRALDAGRKPVETLAFFHVAPGQKIGELFAGPGYTTEVLARTVGPSGAVYAQNTKEMLDRFARKPFEERAARPAMKPVIAVERPMDDPFPPEARDLDAVIFVLNYHDTVWMQVDRAKMNAAIFAALKHGGVYGVIDHSAAAGSGLRDVDSLHRIDEDTVKQEIKAAGFELDGESDVLRNPADPRDWNSSPRAAGEKRGTSDRFVLRFVKP
jgi:predicted methyltransferase